MKDSTYLAEMARHIRMDVLDMVFDVKDGHPGPAFSSADIITALYFGGVLNVDTENRGGRIVTDLFFPKAMPVRLFIAPLFAGASSLKKKN
jgi:transketolase N-terminal domain/subunit